VPLPTSPEQPHTFALVQIRVALQQATYAAKVQRTVVAALDAQQTSYFKVQPEGAWGVLSCLEHLGSEEAG